MVDYSFIRLAATQALAQDLGYSPEVQHAYLGQIQLLPNDPQPYNQATNSRLGVSVGAYTAYIVDGCGNEEDVTSYVTLTAFQENGIDQLKIQLANLPTDYGAQLVYLKIDRFSTGAKFYYSNKFLLTDQESQFTSRLDYVDRERSIEAIGGENSIGFIQSTRLRMYPTNFIPRHDVQQYYQITTGQHVNPRALAKELTEYKFPMADPWTYKRLLRAMLGVCYIDQSRAYLFEAPEYAPREGRSNFSENRFLTDIDDNDFLGIAEVSTSMVDFLASSTELASSTYLSSQLQIPA